MRLNPAKCGFGVRSGKFLGVMVSQRGIEANPEKIHALLDITTPRTKKEIQSLTKRIAAHFLKDLHGATKAVNWTPDCKAAFQSLKDHMGKALILSKPEPGDVLQLYLSVSPSAINLVLIREVNKV